MLYRVVRAVKRGYAFGVFWLYLAAFLLAFALVFVFPPGTILLLFLAIFGLVFFVATGHAIRFVAHLLARGLLKKDICPVCRAEGTLEPASTGQPNEIEAGTRLCRACGAAYLATGAEAEDDMVRYASPARQAAPA